MKTYEFQVRGKSHFPADMLSRNKCWPVTAQDVEKMMLRPEDIDTDQFFKVERIIRLGSTMKPEVGRWESFGWNVLMMEAR